MRTYLQLDYKGDELHDIKGRIFDDKIIFYPTQLYNTIVLENDQDVLIVKLKYRCKRVYYQTSTLYVYKDKYRRY
jgi:hypothetical protein